MAGNSNAPDTAGSQRNFIEISDLTGPNNPPRRTVLTYGTFDCFLPAHVRMLQDLSRRGRELIVGCTSDALCAARGMPTVMPFAQRRALLESCRFVSRVIAEETPEQKRTDIVNYNVSVFAMGMDWQGHFDHLQDITQVIYLPFGTEDAAPLTLAQAI